MLTESADADKANSQMPVKTPYLLRLVGDGESEKENAKGPFKSKEEKKDGEEDNYEDDDW
jgi:hypothetical protein